MGGLKDLGRVQRRMAVSEELSPFLITLTAGTSLALRGEHRSKAGEKGLWISQVMVPARWRARTRADCWNRSSASCSFSTGVVFPALRAGSACHVRRACSGRCGPLPRLSAGLPSHWPAGGLRLIPAKVRIFKMSPFVNLRFSRI